MNITFLRISILTVLFVFLSACNMPKDDNEENATNPEYIAAEEEFARGNYKQAAQRLLPLAQSGNPDAQYALAYMMFEGLGVPQDRMQSYFWFQESAKKGNQYALLALEIFEYDPNLPIDEETSEDLEDNDPAEEQVRLPPH